VTAKRFLLHAKAEVGQKAGYPQALNRGWPVLLAFAVSPSQDRISDGPRDKYAATDENEAYGARRHGKDSCPNE
jgi:hypothetical protein